jgi:hypothetical protein
MIEAQFDHLRPYEEKRIVHLAAKLTDQSENLLLFEAENETVPYEYLKTVSLKLLTKVPYVFIRAYLEMVD